MRKLLSFLGAVTSVLSVYGVEPAYVKHDYIKGSVQIMTNVQEWVESRVDEVSNVQYVQVTNAEPIQIDVQIPQSGKARDWTVFVLAETNAPIALPNVKWWIADFSATNDIPANQPTELHFKKISDGTYSLTRKTYEVLNLEGDD